MPRKKKEITETETPKKEKVRKPKAISPFDIIKMMYTDTPAFRQLSDIILSRNYFMINRTMSIQFPLQAQFFNRTSVDGVQAVKAWKSFIDHRAPSRSVPSFVYTRGAKAAHEEENGKSGYVITNDLKREYCSYYGISLRDFDDMMSFFPDKTYEHVMVYEKIYNNRDRNVIQKIK